MSVLLQYTQEKTIFNDGENSEEEKERFRDGIPVVINRKKICVVCIKQVLYQTGSCVAPSDWLLECRLGTH